MLKCVISIAIVLLSICSGQLRIVRTGNSIKLERGSLEVEERSSNSHPALKASGDEAQSESDILSEKEKRTKKGKGRGRLIDGEAQSEPEILLEKEKKLKREKGLFGALKDANSKARGATSRRQRQIGEGNSDRVVEHEDIEHPVGPIAVVGPMKKVKMCVVVRTYHGHRLEIEIMLRSLLNQHPVLHRSKGVKRQRFHFEFFVVDTQPAFGDSFGFNSYLDEVIERIENTYNEAADYFKVHNLLWDGHKVGTRQQVGDVNAQTTLKKELRVYGYDATDWLRNQIVYNSTCTHLLVTNGDNYYIPRLLMHTYDHIMSGKLIIAWDFITHHVRRDGKQALKVSLDKRGYLDLGAAVVRTDLIKQTGAMFLPPNVTNKEWRYFERDMLFFQTLRKGLTTSQRKQGVELVHQILMAHN